MVYAQWEWAALRIGQVRRAGRRSYGSAASGKHPDAKPLKGFKGAGVLEIVSDFDGNTFRAVYTVKIKGVIYVLHAFQKKSKKGIATPKAELDSRL